MSRADDFKRLARPLGNAETIEDAIVRRERNVRAALGFDAEHAWNWLSPAEPSEIVPCGPGETVATTD